MQPAYVIASIVAGYLVGSISFARVIARIVAPGEDLTRYQIQLDSLDESQPVHAISANSISGRLGARVGMLIATLDILKALFVTLLFRQLFPTQPYYLNASLALMLGHNYPLYHRFLGGSGWTPALGSLLVVDPLSVIVCPLLASVIGLLIFRNITIAMIGWLWILVAWLWLRTHDPFILWYSIGMNVIFLLAMIPVVRNMIKYRAQGKMQAYGRGILAQNPMGRGYVRMAKLLKVKVG